LRNRPTETREARATSVGEERRKRKKKHTTARNTEEALANRRDAQSRFSLASPASSEIVTAEAQGVKGRKEKRRQKERKEKKIVTTDPARELPHVGGPRRNGRHNDELAIGRKADQSGKYGFGQRRRKGKKKEKEKSRQAKIAGRLSQESCRPEQS